MSDVSTPKATPQATGGGPAERTNRGQYDSTPRGRAVFVALRLMDVSLQSMLVRVLSAPVASSEVGGVCSDVIPAQMLGGAQSLLSHVPFLEPVPVTPADTERFFLLIIFGMAAATRQGYWALFVNRESFPLKS